jgi:hypothetical protein
MHASRRQSEHHHYNSGLPFVDPIWKSNGIAIQVLSGGSIKGPENHLALPLSADSMSLIRQKGGYGRDTPIYARSAS